MIESVLLQHLAYMDVYESASFQKQSCNIILGVFLLGNIILFCFALLCFVLLCFSRQDFSLALEPVLELAIVDQAGLELIEICLPLPPEYWN